MHRKAKSEPNLIASLVHFPRHSFSPAARQSGSLRAGRKVLPLLGPYGAGPGEDEALQQQQRHGDAGPTAAADAYAAAAAPGIAHKDILFFSHS